MAKPETVAQALQTLIEIYGDRIESQAKQKAYQAAFIKLEDNQLLEAVQRHVEKSNWFPTIAEIMTVGREITPAPTNLAQEYQNEIAGLQAQRVALAGILDPQAWADLAQEFKRLGLAENENHCLHQAKKIETILKSEVQNE